MVFRPRVLRASLAITTRIQEAGKIVARCSLLKLSETRKESERESFLSKIFLDNLLLNRLFMLENCDNN